MIVRFVCAVLVLAVASVCSAAPDISYVVDMTHPSTHLYEVEIRVAGLTAAQQGLDFVLPAWRSGRYVIFDFAGGVERFAATDEKGDTLRWAKTDKATWHVAISGSRAVVVRYLVFANEPNLRTRSLDDEGGFIDASAVLMYLPEFRSNPVDVIVHPFPGWHVTTSLETSSGTSPQYHVATYDLLADSPLLIGTQRDFPFSVDGIPHVLSLSGRTNIDPDSMISWVKQIIGIDAAYWGGLPYPRYVFLVRALPNGGGGTEHLNSCVLDIRESLLRTPDPGRGYMGLVSHEFFHTWNVKRLRPKGMNPYDWTKENYYRELWLAEGGTSYLDNLLLVRGHLSPVKSYLWGLAQQVESDRRRPGNAEESLVECSFDAWIRYNKPSGDAYNFQTDFYERGAMVSLLLDLELRSRTENRSSLDDLLRLMLKQYPLGSIGYTVDDLERAAVTLCGDGIREFFTRYIFAAGRLPWEAELDHAGLSLTPVPESQHAWLGLGVADDGGMATVHTVVAGSPAYAAGFDIGDQILAVGGLRVNAEDFGARITDHTPGDSLSIAYFHHNELRERLVVLVRNPVPSYSVQKVEKPTRLQKAIYESWLGHPWTEE